MSYSLPVRVELRDKHTNKSCNITIYYDFYEVPVKGDYIILKQSALTVSGRCHYFDDDNARLVIITSSYEVGSYDDMLMILDWFKENYEIQCIEADKPPEQYYNLYRSIITLLNWKDVANIDFRDADVIDNFVSAAIAILMNKIGGEFSISLTKCRPWGQLLRLMILERNNLDNFRIITTIKHWNEKVRELGNLSDDWVVDVSTCIDKLEYVNNNKEI